MAVKNDQSSKQFETFKATARSLGCDEDKERFEAKLGKIARAKSKSPRAKPAKGK